MKKILLLLLLPLITFGQKECVVSVTTDSYPSETYWCLYADSLYGDTISYVSPGYYTQSNTSHLDTCYISDTTTTIVFLMRDTYGDGMNGSYYVSVCEDTIISYPTVSFNSGLYSTRTVPLCNSPPIGACIPAMVNINLDQFQSETSWDIKDTNGTILVSGGPYTNAPDYEPQFIPTCLPVGTLIFTIYDTYGDGLSGSLWGGNDGSYYLMQCGDTLVFGDVPNFGTDTSHVFQSDTCTPPPPVPGCMDENYLEYNPLATVSDSSCVTLKVLGCTDSTMYNYDSLANYMDYIDSCDYTLILHDLVGNGWVGSRLEVYQDDTTIFYMNNYGSNNQQFTIQLNAPEEVSVKFFVSAQASNTALECGFTLKNPMGDTVLSVVPPFLIPFNTYTGITYCGNECIEIVEGCMDSTAFNYNHNANTPLPCYYYPGCISPAYLEYHEDTTNGYITDINIQDSCQTLAVFGCMDSSMFNYDSSANVDNGGCVPIILGCMQPLAFNYNPLANTSDTCIAFIYGCTDPTMFNYNSNANCDDGSCIPFVYGCTDSLMFNFNPLANAEYNPSNCEPYLYGCTDPSMLNYNPAANTDNGSCVAVVEGCMDPTAYNYSSSANVNDSVSCLYNAGCVTGAGNPYWLNDPCYAWVIEVDEYCCDSDWDTICQLTYDYCEGTWVGPLLTRGVDEEKKLIMITDILGRPTKEYEGQLLFYIYSDGSVEKKLIK